MGANDSHICAGTRTVLVSYKGIARTRSAPESALITFPVTPKKVAPPKDKDRRIIIKGAQQHNLKGFDLELPRGKLVVFTGPSGSGKSSLAFDTIYAEGQRRYVESLSAYARQFLERMDKPDVDMITGLAPAIAIEQRTTTRNPRSTVATQTEIYDHLRLFKNSLAGYHRILATSLYGIAESVITK